MTILPSTMAQKSRNNILLHGIVQVSGIACAKKAIMNKRGLYFIWMIMQDMSKL